ncbi:rubredoxin [Methanoculleus sp.]|uniref:rubredoxin n=1 Tax=Methanoculleus sp. TaxID=90427 RepID=UPI0025F4828D|nr:rubredoxin [Methanoculleus sp.]
MDSYRCSLCGYIYNPAIGDPAHGVEPETTFENLPASWKCPRCGAPKSRFVKV